jgi:ribosomal protein S18 acetylase RimI-like enzyme
MRQYKDPEDFKRIGDFLIKHYQPGNRDGNWLQPTWEYMHSHPLLDESALDRIGIWEDSGEIVAVVHYESKLGEVFFENHLEYTHLKPKMLDYAEKYLFGNSKTGRFGVRAYVNDFDTALETLVRSQGYQRTPEYDRPMSKFSIPDPFPKITVPDGFHIKSLQDENNLHKIHRALWRGFNHPGEPPEDGIEDRRKMQMVPNFREDLNIVVEAPNGNFVAYSGTWYEGTNRYAYVEPVATDPDYRRMGLGTAAVLEGVRRCGELGATVAYVGSDLPFYTALGFTRIFNSQCWTRYLDTDDSPS